jgi:hypothetical protein
VNLLRRKLKVLLSDQSETVAKFYSADDVTVIRSGKPQLKKQAGESEEDEAEE